MWNRTLLCSHAARAVAVSIMLAAISIAPARGAGVGKDIVIQLRTSGPLIGVREEAQYWTPTLRVSDDPQLRTITDFEKHTVTMINKRAKTYWTRSFSELSRAFEEKKAERQLIPAEARQRLGATEPARLRATGRVEKIVGYDASEYLIEGPLSGAVWMSTTIDVAAGAQEWARLAALIGAVESDGRRLSEGLATVAGFPMRLSVNRPSPRGPTTTTTEVVEITERSPSPEVLSVPEGFTLEEP